MSFLSFRREHTVAFLHYALRKPDPSPPPSGAERVKGEVGAGTSLHDTTDPHSALCADLSLAGRGVCSWVHWKQFAPRSSPSKPSRPLSAPSGAERVRVRWGLEHRPTTQPTLTRRCAPASPYKGEASFSAVELWCTNRSSFSPSHVDSSPSPLPPLPGAGEGSACRDTAAWRRRRGGLEHRTATRRVAPTYARLQPRALHRVPVNVAARPAYLL